MTTTRIAPVGPAAAPVRQPVRRLRRFTGRVRTTPGRLSAMVVVLVLTGLVSGGAGWLALDERAGVVHDLTVRSSPLGASALDIYRSLSDADASAAGEFLASGAGSTALRERVRQRYLDAIRAASFAMTQAARNSEAGGAAAQQLLMIGDRLPVYTGLVEAARTIGRQGLPLGAAYLREASGLMRGTLLPAAQRLYDLEKTRLAGAQDSASRMPWTAIGLGVLTLSALVTAQVHLSRRTNRGVNVGLALATLAALGSTVWITLATVTMADHLDTGRRDGSDRTQVLAEARIAALQARADEALTLVARGSGKDFEDDFVAAMDRLDQLMAGVAADGSDSSGAQRAAVDRITADIQEWADAHARLRTLDDDGDYPAAVAMATASGATDIPAVFATVDNGLASAITASTDVFDREAEAAQRALAGSRVAVAVLTLVLAAGAIVGVQRRIAEYR
jgi:hypothetical protein